ncbi:zinc-finger double domain-containing protein [Ditylenchus destructor]|uniref:Zinc-finger double domain-containing protein n=1 Tax=Ditylenchus destructor TaxID=166010 RepID=A0AAD4MEA4_9BILA|nr:zinc-finger double domain-containing protein [Ditylenchus destructor]
MDPTPFFCDECHMDLDESNVRNHISAIHLNYFPFKCFTCKAKGVNHVTLSKELMYEHTSTVHQGNAMDVRLFMDRENELEAAVEMCRRPSAEQLSLNDSKHDIRQGFISLCDTLTDTRDDTIENEVTSSEIKQEYDSVEAHGSTNNDNIGPANDAITHSIQFESGSVRGEQTNSNVNLQENIETEENAPQIQADNSLATSNLDRQNQQQNGFGESTDESEFGDEVCEYGRESESNDDTLTSKSRARDNKKNNHCESNESTFQGSSRPKVRPQFKKKCQISYLKANVGPKRAVDGETYHKCKQCHYVTKHKGHFTAHMRTHSGEKPYKCQFCKYATAHSSNLIRHNRIHTGEKPFKCQFCKYATAQSHHLTEHIRIHTGEKPFKCRFCQYASRYSSHLNVHVRRKHDALKFHAANSKKNAERNLLKKSAKND